MKISDPHGVLSRAIQSEPKLPTAMPGLLLNLGFKLPGNVPLPVSLNNESLLKALTAQQIKFAVSPTATAPLHHLLVTPAQVPFVVPEALLDPLETASRQLARAVGHHLGITVDALWFMFHVREVAKNWHAPGGEPGDAVYKVLGLASGAAGLINDFSPRVPIPDTWIDSVDCVVSSGSKVYEGQLPALGDLGLSGIQRTQIASHLVKLAGATFDQSPHFQALTPSSVVPPPNPGHTASQTG